MKFLLPILLIVVAIFLISSANVHAQSTPQPTYYCIGGSQNTPCITVVPSPTLESISITPTSTPSTTPSQTSCTAPTADIVFVLDTSDSMGEKSGSIVKIQAAVIAMSSYMDAFTIIPKPNQLKAALVTFAQHGELNRHLTTNFQSVKNTIIKQAGDLTYRSCVQCGIDSAQQEIQNNSTSTNKIIVLVTDGYANWTETMKPPTGLDRTRGQQAALQAAIKANKATGVKIYTVGVGTPGLNNDFSVLKQIAKATGGTFFYTPTANQLKATYIKIADINESQVKASALSGTSLAACITPTPTCPPGTIPASSSVSIASVQIKQHMPHRQGLIQQIMQSLLQTIGISNNSNSSTVTSQAVSGPSCISPTPTPTDTPTPTPTDTPTPSPTDTPTPTPTPICKPPADFLLALDVSDSMSAKSGKQTKINAAVSAINNFINAISQNPQDRASFVTYAQSAKLVKPLTSNFASVQSAVTKSANDLSFRTCTQCAIDAMEQQVLTNKLNDHKFAVLVSDGYANWTSTMKPTDPLNQTLGQQAALQAAINAHNTSGLVIYTIGLGTPGTSANFSNLQQIAKATGGQFFSSPTADQLNTVYQKIATSIQYGGVCKASPTPTCTPRPVCKPGVCTIPVPPSGGWCPVTPAPTLGVTLVP